MDEDESLAREAFERLEEALFQAGRFGEMEKIYREALALRPDDSTTVDALANFLARKGEKTEAVEVCRGYLARHPDDRRARLRLALLSRDLGEAEEALTHLLALIPREEKRDAYRCPACGYLSDQLLWRCTSCGQWSVFRRSS